MADAAALLAEAAQELSEAARSMYQGLQPETKVLIEPEINAPEHQPVEDDKPSSCQSLTEDPNTGNNLLRPDFRVGTSNTLNPHATPHTVVGGHDQSSLHDRRSPAPANHAPIVTDQDEFCNAVMTPGRHYIVLEEEFDILPLIVAYASICRKTLCCMPFIEDSQSWRVLLSSFLPKHEVLEVSSQVSSLSPSAARYMSSNKSSVLIQSFTSWQTHQTVSSISDSFLVWGFLNVGEEQLTCIQDTILNARHTCTIVTSQEYLRSNFRAYLSSLDFTKHPTSSLIKRLHPKGLLAGFRTTVQKVLRKSDYQENIRLLYKECLEFYKFPPSKDIWWSETRVAELANNFAARTFLRGRQEDGSARFKPDGQMIRLDRESIDKFGLNRALQLGLITEDTSESSNLAQPSYDPNAPTGKPRLEPDTNEWLRLKPLLYDTNAASKSAIPSNGIRQLNYAPFSLLRKKELASNLAGGSTSREAVVDPVAPLPQHVESSRKVVCFISHGSTALPYQALFTRMFKHQIICPGKKTTSINNAIYTFNSLQSGLLLLRGGKNIPSPLDHVDAVIHWGVPPESNLSNHLKIMKATNGYVILSSDVDLKSQQRLTAQNGVAEYPGSALAQLNSTGPQSLLHSYRTRTRQAFENIPIDIPHKIYHCQVDGLPAKGGRELVVRANQFAARVLLHGIPEDGSALYPPVRSRPFVKRRQVTKWGLQPYIDEGLVWVG
ncbi:hypothetical protein B0J17DRAFT_772490 [Rhizoctonia solani]|nr:hypothetical protein B0J17DRAFT_772490 [Rhizoctonia solani]